MKGDARWLAVGVVVAALVLGGAWVWGAHIEAQGRKDACAWGGCR
jgi:uncharacterized protein YdgA (DUF945 family)